MAVTGGVGGVEAGVTPVSAITEGTSELEVNPDKRKGLCGGMGIRDCE